jgi:hypothetical protein
MNAAVLQAALVNHDSPFLANHPIVIIYNIKQFI